MIKSLDGDCVYDVQEFLQDACWQWGVAVSKWLPHWTLTQFLEQVLE